MRTGSKLPIISTLALTLTFGGGCGVFAPAGKRGNVEDELAVETEMALRTLDGTDAASALPSLVTLADNAGRMDEVGLRIQTLMLIAKTLDAEANLWEGERAEKVREAARRQADNALREATDWRRFEPSDREAALLVHDARILRARMNSHHDAELEALLRPAVNAALTAGDWGRAAAWQLALCQLAAGRGRLPEARGWYGGATGTFSKIEKRKGGAPDDPATESLRLAFAEAKADVAALSGDIAGASGLYETALDRARKLRRRAEIQRILLKLAEMSDKAGDSERSEWYRRRAKGVVKKSPQSPGDRLLGKAGESEEKPPEPKK